MSRNSSSVVLECIPVATKNFTGLPLILSDRMSNIFEVGVALEASFTMNKMFFAFSRNLSKGFALIGFLSAFIIVLFSSPISTLLGYTIPAILLSIIETFISSLPYGIFISILSSYIPNSNTEISTNLPYGLFLIFYYLLILDIFPIWPIKEIFTLKHIKPHFQKSIIRVSTICFC